MEAIILWRRTRLVRYSVLEASPRRSWVSLRAWIFRKTYIVLLTMVSSSSQMRRISPNTVWLTRSESWSAENKTAMKISTQYSVRKKRNKSTPSLRLARKGLKLWAGDKWRRISRLKGLWKRKTRRIKRKCMSRNKRHGSYTSRRSGGTRGTSETSLRWASYSLFRLSF